MLTCRLAKRYARGISVLVVLALGSCRNRSAYAGLPFSENLLEKQGCEEGSTGKYIAVKILDVPNTTKLSLSILSYAHVFCRCRPKQINPFCQTILNEKIQTVLFLQYNVLSFEVDCNVPALSHFNNIIETFD